MVSVIVAVDKPIWKTQFQAIIDEQDNINVGYANSLDEVMFHTENTRYDVGILDLGDCDQKSTLRTMLKIHEKYPRSRFVLVVSFVEPFALSNFIRAGVFGFIDEHATPEEIENAVKAALRGDIYVSASLVDRGVKLRMSLAEELFKGIPNLNCEVNCLTEREFEILKLVAQGKSNSEIAKELFVSEKTVKNHLYSAFRKIGVRDRTQAAISVIKSLLSYENGSLDTA